MRKKGAREFTQGFHIQSPMCADTDIGYALSIIKNYEYKPEEYALHSGRLNKSEKMRVKQCQAEKMEKISLPLEALIGEKIAEQTLWHKVKSYISSIFQKKTFSWCQSKDILRIRQSAFIYGKIRMSSYSGRRVFIIRN